MSGRPRIHESKVELLPVTEELMALLAALSRGERQEVFDAAEVPFSSYHQWRLGYNHPNAKSLDALAKVLGKKLQLVDATAS